MGSKTEKALLPKVLREARNVSREVSRLTRERSIPDGWYGWRSEGLGGIELLWCTHTSVTACISWRILYCFKDIPLLLPLTWKLQAHYVTQSNERSTTELGHWDTRKHTYLHQHGTHTQWDTRPPPSPTEARASARPQLLLYVCLDASMQTCVARGAALWCPTFFSVKRHWTWFQRQKSFPKRYHSPQLSDLPFCFQLHLSRPQGPQVRHTLNSFEFPSLVLLASFMVRL